MAGKTLAITYSADAAKALAAQKQIDAGHTKMTGGLSKTSSAFQSTFGSLIPLSFAAAGAAAVGAAKFIIDAATSENEALNKSRVIFEQSSATVERFSDKAAAGFGISKAAALEAAGGFGAMYQSAGIAEKASADMSVTMVKLAGDMASFNNTDPSEMLEKLRSGLAGEAEPLRQFGVFLSEAAVQSEAVRMGIAKQGEELTDAQKIQARYNIIQQQTTKQSGDFARTLGESLPNQMRVFKAEITDLAAEVGGALLPSITTLAKEFADLITKLEPVIVLIGQGLATAVELAAENIEQMAGPLQYVLDLLGKGGEGFKDNTASVFDYAKAIANIGNPITTFTNLHGKLDDVVGIFTGTLGEETEALETQHGVIGDLSHFYRGAFAEAMDTAAEKTDLNTAATKALTGAQRENRLAVLAATDSFLGIQTAAQDVAEAQRELNRLERQGKEDTKAYSDAVIDALGSQIQLEDSVLSYSKELVDSGAKQKDVSKTIRDMGKDFGLTKGDVSELIREIQSYRRELQAIPEHVTTHIGVITPGGFQTGGGFQHGGIITRPTVGLIGEAGPEAVIPLSSPRAGRMMGGGASVVVNVNGSVIAEADLATTIRNELIRLGDRNGNIFGGRA